MESLKRLTRNSSEVARKHNQSLRCMGIVEVQRLADDELFRENTFLDS